MAFDLTYFFRYNERIVVPASTIGGVSGTGAISSVLTVNLAPDKALISDAGGKITVSNASATEVSYSIGVTSPIQTQLNGKESTLTKGNLTEATSSVLTITGGTASVIGSGATIQVKQAATGQSGYLSSTDWNTFNNKISPALNSGFVYIGNGSNVATPFNTTTGDILASISTGLTIKNSAITNVHIAAAAAITRTKLATGTAYRILANNSSGVISENAALTASQGVVIDANGQLVASASSAAQVGYLSTTTGDVQVQIDNKIATRNVSAIVKAPTITQNLWAIMWDNTANQYILADPILQGIPAGGTTRQFLGKNSATIYDSSWLSLVTTDISDITASAAQINVLSTGFYDATTSVQTQLDNKLDKTLNQNYIFVGDASNHAVGLASGANGYVITSVSGVPTWVAPSGGVSGLTTNRVPYATSSTTLGDDASLVWDSTNKALTVTFLRIHTKGSNSNVFIGNGVGNFTLSGANNNAVGISALNGLTTGAKNTCFGSLTGVLVTTGSDNTLFGYTAGQNITTGSNNIIIGSQANAQSATGSNQLSIQNIIFGTGNSATGVSSSTGNIGIGAPPAVDKFEIWHSGTQYLGLTTDGRLYGKALHNNAGSITGTTNQYVASGTYTPTLTNTTNVSSSTAAVCQWIRVGNVVTVSGSVDITPTSGATVSTNLDMSLPIASTFTLASQGGGACSDPFTPQSGSVNANSATGKAVFSFKSATTSSRTFYFTFTYVIV